MNWKNNTDRVVDAHQQTTSRPNKYPKILQNNQNGPQANNNAQVTHPKGGGLGWLLDERGELGAGEGILGYGFSTSVVQAVDCNEFASEVVSAASVCRLPRRASPKACFSGVLCACGGERG